MSEHTNEYLDENSAIGYTKERGNAWWWRKGMTNHYEGSVPAEIVEKILDRCFAIERPVFITDENGNPFQDKERKAIYIPHYKNVAYYATNDFQIHQAKDKLLGTMRQLLNGVGYASVGALKHGARPYVQLEYPQNEEAAGFKFRVGLLGSTSLDGSLKTIFKDTLTGVVCDNTLSAALWGAGDSVKIKHTSNSLARFEKSGDAFTALKELAEKMGYAIERAAKRVVTETQFQAFLEKLVPMPKDWDEKAGITSMRGYTIATNKRNEIANLYHNDERAAPWAGSVLGVMQAVNTFNNHESRMYNVEHRAERISDNLVTGKLDVLDALAMETINKVLVAA